MALPRDVSLRSTPDGPRLVQQPVPEVDALAGRPTFQSRSVRVREGAQDLPRTAWAATARIDATIEPGRADEAGLTLFGDGAGSATRVGYDRTTGRLVLDRRASGDTSFHPSFASRESVPVPLDRHGRIGLRIYVDQSSVEVFTADGRHSLTDVVFPNAGATRIGTYADGGGATVRSMAVRPLRRSMFLPNFERASTPRVVGSARPGRTLVASPGSWRPRPTSFTYRWTRDGETVQRATGATYRVRPEDVGRAIAVEVTARRDGVRPTTATSAPVTVTARR